MQYPFQGMITYPTLGKIRIIFKRALGGDMLVPRRVWNILTRGCWCEAPLKSDGLKTDPVSFFGVKRPLFRGKQLPSLKLTVSPRKKRAIKAASINLQRARDVCFWEGKKKTWICIMFDAIPAKVPKLVWWFFTNTLEKIWARQKIFETTSYLEFLRKPYIPRFI